MKKQFTALLVASLVLVGLGNSLAAEADATRIELLKNRKTELIEQFERARALADALKAMNQAEAEFRRIIEEERVLNEKLEKAQKAAKEK